MISQILVPLAGTILFYVLFHVVQIAYRELTSPLRRMRGPKNPSFIYGNSQEMAQEVGLTDKWRHEFGATFRFWGLFSISELHVSDIKAINHIISNSNVYRRAPFARARSSRLTGDGILSAEGDDHKRFRRISNPAFGVPQMRVITEVFLEKAIQLRDIWARQASHDKATGRIEVLSWVRLMTLDIIGQAGFNYDFEALEENKKPNELNDVLLKIFHSPLSNRYDKFRLAGSLIPILGLVPLPGKKLFRDARTRMYVIGSQILAKSKAAINEGEKNIEGKRDLLSILLKANVSPDVQNNQRLTDEELVSQIPTFFVAGHETTSLATAWALHALSVNPAVQTKLREELLAVSTDTPTMDELNSLTYLEWVVRETMRVYAPITMRHRMAMEDDVLPLSKPYIDKDGKSYNSLHVPKGQTIHIPILAINTDTELWGEDAKEWKPDRWANIPDAVTAIPGVWANLLTFFAGPHNCIGFRFAVLELKVLLFTVVRAFEIERAVAEGSIVMTAGSPQRPVLLADGNKKSSLPLIFRPYNAQEF
ncbi:cytochrome P450 [Mycena galericulata]|nr:cytochrome P450 [Mycena galericulata]